MNEAIRDLLLSDNREDMELGLVLARNQNISPNHLFEEVYKKMKFPNRIPIWNKYINSEGGWREDV